MVPRILGPARAPARSRQRRPRRRGDPAGRFRLVQPRPHLRHGRGRHSTSGDDAEADARARSATHLRVRPHRRAGTPLAADPLVTPTTTSRPTSTSSPTSCSPRPGWPTTRSPTGRCPGHECRHNLLYWRQHDYLGFGCAPHSHVAGRRWWNVRTPERYIAAVAAGQTTEAAARRSTPRRGGSRGCSWRCARRPACPARRSTATASPTSSSAWRSLGAHPPWPTARQRGGGPPALITW